MPRTLAGQTARKLRQDIIQGKLRPGERLTFERLTRMYEVGSSPLREALFQVAAEGLVHGEDHKGFIVAPINLGEMMDVSSLRAQLEMFAASLSIEHGGEEWETRVLSASHRLKRAEVALRQAGPEQRRAAEDDWEQRHREFHYALCSACGSPWALHFFDQLYDQLERYRRHFWQYAERAEAADDEHESILQAALAHDREKTASLLKAHFQKQAALTTDAMQVDPQRLQGISSPALRGGEAGAASEGAPAGAGALATKPAPRRGRPRRVA